MAVPAGTGQHAQTQLQVKFAKPLCRVSLLKQELGLADSSISQVRISEPVKQRQICFQLLQP